MSFEQRKYPRYPCQLKINLKSKNGKSWPMSTLDVSLEGMRILSKEKDLIIEPSSLVTIEVQKQKDIDPFFFSGSVKHYSLEQNGNTIFGVEIKPLTDETKENWPSALDKIKQSLE